jgi:hypothetical protein
VLVTDKLGSYGATKAEIGLSARHERACARTIGLKIRISRHGDASADAALQIAGISQHFLSIHATVQNTFNVKRRLPLYR